MKIGDKVRFLTSIGGGVVAGFQGKNIVLVEDEDGFQIPTPINEVVVANDDNYDTARMVKAQQHAGGKQVHLNSDGKSVKALLNVDDDGIVEDDDDDPSIKDHSFKAPVVERKGGNRLSVYLAFVPVDIKQVTNTQFETYLVNDSNYHMHYTYMSAENDNWIVRSHGVLEPNTKEYVEEFSQREVNALSRVCVQLLPFKEDKSFVLKPAVDVQMRIDQVKFYKIHTFQPNDFFEEPALLYPIVENDKVVRSLGITAQQLKEEMYAKPEELDKLQTISAKPVRKGLENALVVDLHAEKLLDTTAGMSSADILNYQLDHFRSIMKEHRGQRGFTIVFIHGKGEGVLRQAIIHELNYRYKSCSHQDASFQEYGYGATQVIIK